MLIPSREKREKNGMIRWRCACRASKHCPANAYTDLLPANPVLKTDHNHCPEPVKPEVDRCKMDMSIRAAASNDPPARIYVLPKCMLPKCPITKMSGYRNVQLPKCPVTEMSCYQNVCYQNVHYQSVFYRNVWIPAAVPLADHFAKL